MHKFAETLKKYEYKIPSYRKLSAAVNIDRTTLKRYVLGERLPKSIDTVKAIAVEIGLSQEEEYCLMEAYKRTKMGEKKYRGYNVIDRIFSGRNMDEKNGFLVSYNQKQRENIDGIALINVRSMQDIINTLIYMCENTKHLKMMIQPGQIYKHICEIIENNEECKVELLIQLDSCHYLDNLADVELFEKVYKMLNIGQKCDVYSSYDCGCNEIIVANNYILADNGVLTFNILDGEKIVGFYTKKEEVIRYFYGKYKKSKERCHIYASSTRQWLELKKNTEKILENINSHVIFEVCEVDSHVELWIRDSRYIRIMERSMIELFNKYIDNSIQL